MNPAMQTGRAASTDSMMETAVTLAFSLWHELCKTGGEETSQDVDEDKKSVSEQLGQEHAHTGFSFVR